MGPTVIQCYVLSQKTFSQVWPSRSACPPPPFQHVGRLEMPNLTLNVHLKSFRLESCKLGKLHILKVATQKIAHLGNLHLKNCTFGKLPLGKLHILEVATWEIVPWKTTPKLLVSNGPPLESNKKKMFSSHTWIKVEWFSLESYWVFFSNIFK